MLFIYLVISNFIITFAFRNKQYNNKQIKYNKIMITIFIIICVAVLVLDEAKKKHIDLEKMINNVKED